VSADSRSCLSLIPSSRARARASSWICGSIFADMRAASPGAVGLAHCVIRRGGIARSDAAFASGLSRAAVADEAVVVGKALGASVFARGMYTVKSVAVRELRNVRRDPCPRRARSTRDCHPWRPRRRRAVSRYPAAGYDAERRVSKSGRRRNKLGRRRDGFSGRLGAGLTERNLAPNPSR
jgi:hypothetical protein